MADSLLGAEADEGALRRLIANSEQVLQNQLEAELNRRGFETIREMVVVPRDRVDVAVYPNSDLQDRFQVSQRSPDRGRSATDTASA